MELFDFQQTETSAIQKEIINESNSKIWIFNNIM